MNTGLSTALIRQDFFSFFQRAFYETSGGQFIVPAWYFYVLCDKLEKVRCGEIKRLIINLPPRSLKSQLINVAFTAWTLAKSPKKKIISVSYSAELADEFARDTKRIMTSDWYKTLFPKSQIANEQSSATDFKTHSHGGRFTTSVDGTITGRGGNLIVIDDPINTSNTTSETALNKVNEWYKKTLLSRLDNQETDSIVLMMQRVHENDLTGYLLENEPDKWDVIKIPQIAIENETWLVGNKTFVRNKGQVLNPNYTGLEKSLELKQSLGSYVWESQYQQNPIAVESGIIKPEWLHYEDQITFDRNDVRKVYLSWDTASKTGTDNAYSACVVIVMTRDRKLHLVDVYRDKWEIPELIKETKDIYNQWASNLGNKGQITLLVEEAASGVALNQFLAAEYNNGGSYFNTVAIKPHGDKASRLINSSVVIESGRLLFPSESRNLHWWYEFKKELLGFPGTKYKDQVDALSQVIRYILDEESQ